MSEPVQKKFAQDGEAKVPSEAKQQVRDTTPVFTVKAKGVEGYVGSGWINEGKFGKYISVKLKAHMDAGATLYLSPTKAAGKLLG